jgi:hypothetical protein
MKTLDEISNDYHISKRTLESNLTRVKLLYENTDKLMFNGQKWLADASVIKAITERKYCKHYTQYDNSIIVDDIDLKSLINENELKVFLTIAPKGIKSILKLKDVVRDTFEYYQQQNKTDPTFFIYGIENNTDYFDEKQNKGFHIHAVTNAPYHHKQQQEITANLKEEIDPNRIHEIYTVNIAPYEIGIGIGGLNYSLKMNTYTGAYIK